MKKENKLRLGSGIGGMLGLAAFAAAEKLIGFESFTQGRLAFCAGLVLIPGGTELGVFLTRKIASK